MTPASHVLRAETRNGVATATLCRLDGPNRLDRSTVDAVRIWAESVSAAAHDGSVRVAVLTNDGFVFNVGGDLRSFAEAGVLQDDLRYVATRLHEALVLLTGLPVPLVTAVDGVAAGAGLGLAFTGDVVLTSHASTFRTAYLAVGLSPDGGASWHSARRLGHARAAEFALSNRVMLADEALSVGLVSCHRRQRLRLRSRRSCTRSSGLHGDALMVVFPRDASRADGRTAPPFEPPESSRSLGQF